jgi:hypothetical protein
MEVSSEVRIRIQSRRARSRGRGLVLGGGARLPGCLQFRCRRPSDGSAYGRDKAYPSPDFPGKIHGGVAD